MAAAPPAATGAAPGLRSAFAPPDRVRAFSALIALALIVLYNIIFTTNFLTLNTFNANLTQVATIVIVTGFYLVSIGLSTYLDPRTRLVRLQVKG